MLRPLSPCGAWRLVVRPLGVEVASEIAVLARLDPDGAVTVFTGGTGTPGLGSWRAAGPGRVVVIAEWFVRDGAGRVSGRTTVRVAAELVGTSRCTARMQWRRYDLGGRPDGVAATGEAEGSRLDP